MRRGCDVCLVRVNTKILKKNVAKFGSGKLEVNDKVMIIGHPSQFVGTGVTGHVTYPCIENPPFDLDDTKTCEYYVSTALEITPTHRIMGHIWNKRAFRKELARGEDVRDLEFDKNLIARTPIIQCTGLRGGKGMSGGPLFNEEGKVVGMMVCNCARFEYGIHVSALKKFLESQGIQPL